MAKPKLTTRERLEALKRGEVATTWRVNAVKGALREKGKRGRPMREVKAEQAAAEAQRAAEEKARIEAAAKAEAEAKVATALAKAVAYAKACVLRGEDPRQVALRAGKAYDVPPRDVLSALV